MGYKSFLVRLLIRVTLLLAILTGLSFCFMQTEKLFTILLLFGILAFVLFELVWFLSRPYYFFNMVSDVLKSRERNLRFTGLFDYPHSTKRYNELLSELEKTSASQQATIEYLYSILLSVEMGIVSLSDIGKLHWINPFAKKILELPDVGAWDQVRAKYPGFSLAIENLKPGQKSLVELI